MVRKDRAENFPNLRTVPLVPPWYLGNAVPRTSLTYGPSPWYLTSPWYRPLGTVPLVPLATGARWGIDGGRGGLRGESEEIKGRVMHGRRLRSAFTHLLLIVCGIFFVGWFESGQEASLILGAPDFNNAGGGLLFNHPGAPAIDGTRLYLPDKHNNRILIWKELPQGNVAPDFVLGQRDFISNAPGGGREQLNWPVSVAAGKGIVAVADTYNDRILIWLTEPEQNYQAADIQIRLRQPAGGPGPAPGPDPGPGGEAYRMEWPWAVWTDGERLIVTATGGSQSILIWHSIPQKDDQPPDLVLYGRSGMGTADFGTPRSILSDGMTFLAVGDHNAKNQITEQGTFVWDSFPSQPDAPYDRFFAEGAFSHGLLWGGRVLPGKPKVALGTRLYLWPADAAMTRESLSQTVGRSSGPAGAEGCDAQGFPFHSGDGSGWAMSEGGQLFVSLANANRVVVYNAFPSSGAQCPDYAVGAPDIGTNTLRTHHMITNAIVASDGESLFAFSDFDRTFSVWTDVPTQSGTLPKVRVDLDFAPWDAALAGDLLFAGGGEVLAVWNGLPRQGRAPDVTFRQQLGGITFGGIVGVAYAKERLFLSDREGGRVLYFSHGADSEFEYVGEFKVERAGRLSADDTYLAAASYDPNEVRIYRLADLKEGNVDALAVIGKREPGRSGSPSGWNLELPQNVLLAEGHLFVADTNRNRVLGWQSVEDAIAGVEPDLVLGASELTAEKTTNFDPPRRLHMPAGLAYANGRLWVGGFKFSNYVVAFADPAPPPAAVSSSPAQAAVSGCGCAAGPDPVSVGFPLLVFAGLVFLGRRRARN